MLRVGVVRCLKDEVDKCGPVLERSQTDVVELLFYLFFLMYQIFDMVFWLLVMSQDGLLYWLDWFFCALLLSAFGDGSEGFRLDSWPVS